MAWNLWKNIMIESLADRVFNVSWTHSQVVLRQINANATKPTHSSMDGLPVRLIYANPLLRAESSILSRIAAGSPVCGATPFRDLPISAALQLRMRQISIWCAGLCKPRILAPEGAACGSGHLE